MLLSIVCKLNGSKRTQWPFRNQTIHFLENFWVLISKYIISVLILTIIINILFYNI